MSTKRRIAAHKGGRTARAPEARIRPQTLERIRAEMQQRGMSFADLLEDTYSGGNGMADKDEYKVWASNDQGASTDVAGNKKFTSQRAAEDAARREMGSGWTIHIMHDGEEVKKFRIR